ncbi:uncharacterized protein LOC135401457 isoform X2 [Ornithodoros turicata]|uniref:uncharacterized protein LOC135401457 isoform X2 n=1 Tax=Ornithodoros turicata TaxID=34597 RepID=UPI0031398E7F
MQFVSYAGPLWRCAGKPGKNLNKQSFFILSPLLAGKPHTLEKKRNKLVAASESSAERDMESAASQLTDDGGPTSSAQKIADLQAENARLKNEVEVLKRSLDEAERAYAPAKMVKRLERMLDKVHKPEGADVVPCTKVDIGSGVLVESTVLARLGPSCKSGVGKYVRALLRHVFQDDELRGKSLYGMKCNTKKNTPPKEAIDPVRLNAVIDYTCKIFPGTQTSYLKNSLSSLLAREIK